jgi:xanthine/uracil permease
MTLTGQVTGWFIVAASGGAMLVPLIIGQTFSASGPRLVIVVTTSTLAIAFGVLTFMIRIRKVWKWVQSFMTVSNPKIPKKEQRQQSMEQWQEKSRGRS